MTVKKLIDKLKEFDPNSPVMIHIPQRLDNGMEFVSDLEIVTDWERNDLPDCPQLCTKYWIRYAVGKYKEPIDVLKGKSFLDTDVTENTEND